MGKLSKRKNNNTIGKSMPNYYELQRLNKMEAEKALEKAKQINKPIKYLTK